MQQRSVWAVPVASDRDRCCEQQRRWHDDESRGRRVCTDAAGRRRTLRAVNECCVQSQRPDTARLVTDEQPFHPTESLLVAVEYVHQHLGESLRNHNTTQSAKSFLAARGLGSVAPRLEQRSRRRCRAQSCSRSWQPPPSSCRPSPGPWTQHPHRPRPSRP